MNTMMWFSLFQFGTSLYGQPLAIKLPRYVTTEKKVTTKVPQVTRRKSL